MKVEDFKVGERVHDIGWGGNLLPPENGTVIAVTESTVKVQFDSNKVSHSFVESIDLHYLAHGEYKGQA